MHMYTHTCIKIICNDEQAKTMNNIHPKDIHGRHQEDTVNIGYKCAIRSKISDLKIFRSFIVSLS